MLTADRSFLQTWSGLDLPADVVADFRLLDRNASTQISETVRTGNPVVLNSPSEIRARFPETEHTYLAAGVLMLASFANDLDAGHECGHIDVLDIAWYVNVMSVE